VSVAEYEPSLSVTTSPSGWPDPAASSRVRVIVWPALDDRSANESVPDRSIASPTFAVAGVAASVRAVPVAASAPVGAASCSATTRAPASATVRTEGRNVIRPR